MESLILIHQSHDDVIKWKHSPCYWLFVRGIHRSPVNSPHKGQWRGALMFSLICVWIKGCENNLEVGDLRRYCAHYDVIVILIEIIKQSSLSNIVVNSVCRWPRTHVDTLRAAYDILPNNRAHGAYMGPIFGWQDPGGHHVGPANLANRAV